MRWRKRSSFSSPGLGAGLFSATRQVLASSSLRHDTEFGRKPPGADLNLTHRRGSKLMARRLGVVARAGIGIQSVGHLQDFHIDASPGQEERQKEAGRPAPTNDDLREEA